MKVLLDAVLGTTGHITLDAAPIKEGGEGRVYAGDLSSAVAKVYHVEDDRVRRLKVEAMLRSRPRHAEHTRDNRTVPLLTWPTHVLLYDDDRFAGYVMPRLPADFENVGRWMRRGDRQGRADKREPLSPEDRSLPSRVLGCRNLARLLESVHKQGHRVMDLNATNIYVQRKFMKVCIIDCDGFTIRADDGTRHAASAFKLESVAPELLGLPHEAVLEAADAQDRFALALVIFQWLNNGVHPFQGIPIGGSDGEFTLKFNLKAWRYAYGQQPHAELAPRRDSDHNTFPPGLRRMFDRAFQPETAAARPSPAEWVGALEPYLRQKLFEPCDDHPADVLHVRFPAMPCARCQFLAGRAAVGDSAFGALDGQYSRSATLSASASDAPAVTRSMSVPLVKPAAAAPVPQAEAGTPAENAARRRRLKVAAVVVAWALALCGGYRWSQGYWPWELLRISELGLRP